MGSFIGGRKGSGKGKVERGERIETYVVFLMFSPSFSTVRVYKAKLAWTTW